MSSGVGSAAVCIWFLLWAVQSFNSLTQSSVFLSRFVAALRRIFLLPSWCCRCPTGTQYISFYRTQSCCFQVFPLVLVCTFGSISFSVLFVITFLTYCGLVSADTRSHYPWFSFVSLSSCVMSIHAVSRIPVLMRFINVRVLDISDCMG